MAILNGNGPYLSINGVSVGAYFVEVKLESSAERVDVSHGNTSWMQSNAGLYDATLSATLTYDITNLTTYLPSLARGSKYTVDYGPEGNSSNKPRHTQSMLLTKLSGPSLSVKKDHVTFELTLEGADTPTNDLFAGAVF